MRCKHCDSRVGVLDEVCSHCGRSLSVLNECQAGRPNSADLLIDKVSELVDTELAGEIEALKAEPCSKPAESRRSGKVRQGGIFDAGASWKLGFLSEPEVCAPWEMAGSSLETSHEEIQQIGAFVFYSGHVQSNEIYRKRAAQTSLGYVPEIDMVNAFATDDEIEGINLTPPFIVFLGGMAQATRLAAMGLGYEAASGSVDSKQVLVDTIQGIGQCIVEGQGRLPRENARDMFFDLSLDKKMQNGAALRKARSYSAAMNTAIIAHELGHIALGHTLGRSLNPEISRNQEREADSFASSVASASPFSDYIVAAGVFWWVILSWVESVDGVQVESTHPHARERLMDYIRSNKDQAEEIGVDETTIGEFLP